LRKRLSGLIPTIKGQRAQEIFLLKRLNFPEKNGNIQKKYTFTRTTITNTQHSGQRSKKQRWTLLRNSRVLKKGIDVLLKRAICTGPSTERPKGGHFFF